MEGEGRLVTGLNINQKHFCRAQGLRELRRPGDDCFDPDKNPVLRREIMAARRSYVPDGMIKRVIQFARATRTSIFRSTTPTGSEAYLTVSGQNSNNLVRVTDEFLKAVEADGD